MGVPDLNNFLNQTWKVKKEGKVGKHLCLSRLQCTSGDDRSVSFEFIARQEGETTDGGVAAWTRTSGKHIMHQSKQILKLMISNGLVYILF